MRTLAGSKRAGSAGRRERDKKNKRRETEEIRDRGGDNREEESKSVSGRDSEVHFLF